MCENGGISRRKSLSTRFFFSISFSSIFTCLVLFLYISLYILSVSRHPIKRNKNICGTSQGLLRHKIRLSILIIMSLINFERKVNKTKNLSTQNL